MIGHIILSIWSPALVAGKSFGYSVLSEKLLLLAIEGELV
jgi:hypothetical protein